MAQSTSEGNGQDVNCQTLLLGDHHHQHDHQNNISGNLNIQQNFQNITFVDQRQVIVHQNQLRAAAPQPALAGAEEGAGIGQEIPNQPTVHEPVAPPPESDVNAIINKVTEHQARNAGPDITLHGQLEVDTGSIPVVHPTYVESQFYQGQKTAQSEEFTPSTERVVYRQRHGRTIPFSDLVRLVYVKKFTALIGPAGCGKTTTSKRLVRAANDLVPFHLRFMDLDYSRELTARQLFIEYLFCDFDDATKDTAFAWMKSNPEKCLFVMDGYDQAVWSLENVKPVNASYYTPLTIQQLVANLCCKKFFRESLLIFTSRPHAMVTIPYELRPDVTIDIKDLSTENMKKLFFAFAKDRSDELWETLSKKAPQLLDLCHNPVLLQFIIIAALYSTADDLGSITTITGVFGAVLEHLRHSDHARGLDINMLWEPLGRMAYKGMKRKSVVFTIADLKKEGLIDVDVQDLVIVIARHLAFNQCLFDGDKVIFFVHQMLQEKFAAKYISSYILEDEFYEVIDEVVAGGHWAMVRRFLCGLLLGQSSDKDAKPSAREMPLPVDAIGTIVHCPAPVSSEEAEQQSSETDENMEIDDDSVTSGDTIAENRQQEIEKAKASKPLTRLSRSASKARKKFLKFFGFSRKRKADGTSVQGSRLSDTDSSMEQPVERHLQNPVQSVPDDAWEDVPGTSSDITHVKLVCEDAATTQQPKGRSLLFMVKLLHFVETELLRSVFARDNTESVAEVFVDLLEVSDELFNKFVDVIPPDMEFGLEFAQSAIKFHAFIRILSSLTKTVKVINCGQILSDEFSRFLAALETTKCKIKKLDLSCNHRVGQQIDSILQHVEKSDKVNLENCAIHDLSKLSRHIQKRRHELTYLNLAYNPIGNAGLNLLAQCVAYIRELYLEGCGITDVQALVEPMLCQQSKTLSLNLSRNKFGNDGINQLSLFVHKLDELHVRDCGVTDVEQFCQAVLNRSTTMKQLNVRDNAIGFCGAVSLSKCLAKITRLSVSRNEVTQEGTVKLNKASLVIPWSTNDQVHYF